jgi:large subunit ribosomal protein L35
MPKLKTHSGAKDRIRVTKNGKLLHGHTSGNHFLQKKSAARKRRIATTEVMTGKSRRSTRLKLGV